MVLLRHTHTRARAWREKRENQTLEGAGTPPMMDECLCRLEIVRASTAAKREEASAVIFMIGVLSSIIDDGGGVVV